MVKAKAFLCLATVGSGMVVFKNIQAFCVGSIGVGQRPVRASATGGRAKSASTDLSIDETCTKSFRSLSSGSSVLAVAGCALASVAVVIRSAHRQGSRSRNVPRKQAMRDFGLSETFAVGDKVIAYGRNGDWHEGVVTSAAPLLVRPNGWTESRVFDKVVSVGSSLIGMPSAPMMPPRVGPFDPSQQLGVTEPLGFFDPLGLSQTADEETFRHFRAAELKHGRVAMLAAVGCVGQHHIAMPGFEAVPRGLGAFGEFPANFGILLVVLASGYVELNLWKDDKNKLPGDFGNPWCPFAVDVTDDLRNKEINNGRLAMISILGIICAELSSGRDGVEQIFGVQS